MRRKVSIIAGAMFAVALVAAGWLSVCAEDESESAVEEKVYQGIPYISGGIGLEERRALDAVGGKYSLKISLVSEGKSYLADALVEITDTQGKKIFEATADGPLFFAGLPPGKYGVAVTMTGKKQSKSVTVVPGQKQIRLSFYGRE